VSFDAFHECKERLEKGGDKGLYWGTGARGLFGKC
jgi:hypothetical protein